MAQEQRDEAWDEAPAHLLSDGLDEHLEDGDGHSAWHGLQDSGRRLGCQPLQDTLPRVRLHLLAVQIIIITTRLSKPR